MQALTRLLAICLFALPLAAQSEVMTADTPKTTVAGNTFIAPAGWQVSVRGNATILAAPEGGSHVALIDVKAKDADSAVAAAWAEYAEAKWPLLNTNDLPDKDGWSGIRVYNYQTAPNEKRGVQAVARKANDVWTVGIYDMDQGVGEKRGAQVALILGRLLPKGYSRESFAGKTANKLDAKRLAELSRFVEEGRKKLGVPGVSIGIVQDGKVVFADGFGMRDIDDSKKPDADTLYLIASNTKAMTTLMLAKLVDEGKLTWDTPVTKLLPSFRLGDADTTSRVLVRHLICACTGLPRQDFEWIFQFDGVTPEGMLKTLGAMQPTSKFGELFQYSNPLASAGGYVGGHVAFPDRELGAAYDEAMRTLVFTPLGMKSTTFDFKRALAANHAGSHGASVDGKTIHAVMAANYSIIPVRPAGGAWSNVRDVLRYISMELARGVLPNGTRYINEQPLLIRRAPQVPIGRDETYGMGLEVDSTWGIPIVHHGGSMIGYKTDMIFLPDHNVGAVILTNSDTGQLMLAPFRRKLLEVLFDGAPEADARVAAGAKSMHAQIAAERPKLTVPAAVDTARALAPRYHNAALGDITVTLANTTPTSAETWFDFGEWKSQVASRKNQDGTTSFVTITPGMDGLEFVVGPEGQRTLTFRDAQHEYVFK